MFLRGFRLLRVLVPRPPACTAHLKGQVAHGGLTLLAHFLNGVHHFTPGDHCAFWNGLLLCLDTHRTLLHDKPVVLLWSALHLFGRNKMSLVDRIAVIEAGDFPALNAVARFALAHYDEIPVSYFPEVKAPRVWERVKMILLTLPETPMPPLARESELYMDELMHANPYSNCALCGEAMAQDDTMQYPCPDAHQFHTTCMQLVDSHSCPICLYAPSNYAILEKEMAYMAPNYAQLMILENTQAVYTPVKNAGPMMALKRLLQTPEWKNFKAKTLDDVEQWYAMQSRS